MLKNYEWWSTSWLYIFKPGTTHRRNTFDALIKSAKQISFGPVLHQLDERVDIFGHPRHTREDWGAKRKK